MTKEELKKLLQEAEDRYSEDKKRIYFNYRNDLCKFKFGEIISDGENVGKVLNWNVSIYDSYNPIVTYVCEKLKKDGTPRKVKEVCYIYVEKAVLFGGKN